MSNEDPTKQQENKKKALFRFIESRVRAHIGNAREELPEAEAREAYLVGLNNWKSKLIETIPDQEEALSRLFESFATYPMNNEDSFVAAVSGKLTEFITSNYTYEDIERISRNNPRYKNIELNRLVVYGISGDHIHIHIPVTFLEDPADLVPLFIDAMKKLAVKLKSDPELTGIAKVTGESSLIPQAKRALERMGFSIVYIDQEKNEGKIEISKEKLIQLYGN